MNKLSNTQPQPSRQQILSWIHTTLGDVPLSLKIEDLGKGVVYCRMLNHYFPGAILINRIISYPKTEYENTLNLRIFQNAVAQLKLSLLIDPSKLSREKLPDNLSFAVSFYKCMNPQDEPSPQVEQHKPIFYNHMPPPSLAPKRSIEQLYPDHHFQLGRQPLHLVQNFGSKNMFNGSKYSVGKLYRETTVGTSSPNKGKWSVNSHMFQNNLVPIIDRIKQILLKPSHDVEKIRQIKMLLNIPLNEEVQVKVQEDENPIIKVAPQGVLQKPDQIEARYDIKLPQ